MLSRRMGMRASGLEELPQARNRNSGVISAYTVFSCMSVDEATEVLREHKVWKVVHGGSPRRCDMERKERCRGLSKDE